MKRETIKLTQYSHGAGCGCKISPAVLDKMLHQSTPVPEDARLLVGNDKHDDAAVYDLGNDTALISTTDFFMPIVDDPFDFGRIAAANALSDVYAMGGNPVLSIAILGWPTDKLPPGAAQTMLEGARAICGEAGISVAGGHSIDSPEPIFGLAVNGIVPVDHLKQNDAATAGCRLYLTKPLGVGALSTAQKKDLLKPKDATIILESMTKLNNLGAELSRMNGVKAMTDVTGFGLLGHVRELCEAGNLAAEIVFDRVPIIPSLPDYIAQGCIPGGTNRNWSSYGHKIGPVTDMQKNILADPQTSGGLLIAVDPDFAGEFEEMMKEKGQPLESIGRLKPQEGDNLITVV